MRVEHLAIDGSIVSVESDADLTSLATAAGWAVVPSLMQAHPFNIFPPGHSAVMEEAARKVPDVKIRALEEYSLKGGTLRIAEVELPTATGATQHLTVGGWESRSGCLHTSIYGANRTVLTEMFDTLSFSEHSRGLAIDSPVVAQPRPPEVIKEVPGIGVLRIRPAVATELERVPRSRGLATDHGELFRMSADTSDLLFVSESAVVAVKTSVEAGAAAASMLGTVKRLRIEWQPRPGA